MIKIVRKITVAAAAAGRRVDQASAALLPQTGLRGRRRCIEEGLVLVNGRICTAAHKLREGDELSLADAAESAWACAAVENALTAAAGPAPAACAAAVSQARLLAQEGQYCFLYKPSGLHTAALAGSGRPSLEALLPSLRPVPQGAAPRDLPVLLQRLDYATSGIVCAALDAETQATFRRAERAGRCEKRYLAVLCNVMAAPVTAVTALHTADCRKSRPAGPEPNPVRWTEFFPLAVLQGTAAQDFLAAAAAVVPQEGPGNAAKMPAEAVPLPESLSLTLAGCRIRRGARHQIRAHAAELGHTLWGDSLYASEAEKKLFGPAEIFFLHHGAMRLPGAFCVLLPPWPLPESACGAVQKWFEKSDG